MKGIWLFVAFCALVFTQGRSLAQDQNVTHTITDLGTLGGTSSVGCGLNSRGEVVGKSSIVSGEAHAFLWNRNEGIIDLGTLPGLFFSEARDINNRGQVVGDSTKTGGPPFRAVLWDGDAVTDLGTLGGPAAFAIAINKDAQVVGGARAANGQLHAFLWQDSVMTDLGTLPHDTFSVARAINNRGQVAATSAPVQPAPAGDCPTAPLGPDPQRAFLFNNGGITDLGTLGGAIVVPKGINNRGEIVGISSTFAGEAHAFLWSDGAMHDLGTLGGTFSIANGINKHRQAVGLSRIVSGELHAFLWEDGVMTDLNNLIPVDSGWILVEATAINKAGQIAGVGSINGQTHAFLLTPDDEND
jgi:probable HAF family extracellular repeat protein